MPWQFQQVLIRVKSIMSDLKNIHAQRVQESILPLFQKKEGQHLLFLTSSSDMGVIRNNGRNGAKYAPRSFLFHFKKMTQDQDLKNWRFSELEVSSQRLEEENFHEAQKEEMNKIKNSSPLNHQFVCHIGGGHDHIYPLVSALKDQFKKVIVINIDAHADTRTEKEFHSGTPFRQLDEEVENLVVFQLGLHPYSNSFSTLSPLKKEMPVLWQYELSEEKIVPFFDKIREEVTSDSLVIFSLDADALSAHLMPGVSAVNADGLDLKRLKLIMDEYLKLKLHHPPVLGVYELNPVYDQLSGLSMNTIANFLFHTLKHYKGSV